MAGADTAPEPVGEPTLGPPPPSRAVAEPYVAAPQPVPVVATVGGDERTGEVLGWRGDRVYVRTRTAAGSHLGWLAAAQVQRVPAPGDGLGNELQPRGS